MSHNISAVVLKGPFDAELAAGFDMRPIAIGNDLTLFPLDPDYCDCWADKLGIADNVTDPPLLNCRVIHHMIHAIADDPQFAVIETDYFGGKGDQCAVVYRGAQEVMPPERASIGPINAALRMLGVLASKRLDEFDTVGLGHYRHWYDRFESYRDWDSPKRRPT